MPQLLAPFRAMGRRLGPRLRIVLLLGCVLVAFGLIVAHDAFSRAMAGLSYHYKQAAAEADRLDPHWRLDDILAQREKMPDAANSAVKVREIAQKLPGGWSGITQHRVLMSNFRESPEVRRGNESTKQLEEARSRRRPNSFQRPGGLPGLPSGQFDQGRPRIRRLEQIGSLNAWSTSTFPMEPRLNRVVFLLWLDAQLRIDAGEIETALLDLRAIANAGRSIGDYPGLSAQMARSGAVMRAIVSRDGTGASRGSAPIRLAPLQSLLEDEAHHPHRMIALRGERAIIDDLAEQIHAGNRSFRDIPDFVGIPIYRSNIQQPYQPAREPGHRARHQ